jgi:hypothetical protein
MAADVPHEATDGGSGTSVITDRTELLSSSSYPSETIFQEQSELVVYACSPSTEEAKAGGSQVPGKSELHSENLFQKKRKTKTFSEEENSKYLPLTDLP